MQPNYSDILDRIALSPEWWDENGVPRYCDFAPSKIANSAEECCLLVVACQYCGREFTVCISRSKYDRFDPADPQNLGATLAEYVREGDITYGDPPYVGCCNPGPTMQAVPLRIIEFWRNQGVREGGWVRVPDLEGKVTLGGLWVDS